MESERRPEIDSNLEETRPSFLVHLSDPNLNPTPAGPFAYSNSVKVLLCTDIVGSLELKSKMGEKAAASIIRKHDRLFKKVVRTREGGEILSDRGDGFIAAFPSAQDAVTAALLFQYALASFDLQGRRLHVRIGLHLGEVVSRHVDIESRIKLTGSALDVTARICDLAEPDQILMSEVIFNDARRFVKRHPRIRGVTDLPKLRWESHGDFLFKGFDEALQIFEVGHPDIGPFKRPSDGDKARYVADSDECSMAGWRPAADLHLPGDEAWILQDKLGEGGLGEVWLAHHETSGEARAFKFCFEPTGLESLKQDLEALEQTHSRLKDCRGLCPVHRMQFERFPSYIESDYCNRGNIVLWSEFFGGIAVVSQDFLIQVVGQLAETLAEAHATGLVHGAIHPENILLHENPGGALEVRLTDFGIGGRVSTARTPWRDSTASGLTPIKPSFIAADAPANHRSMYLPPEVVSGDPWSPEGDIYSLGIVFYQMMVADFRRPIAPGWERHVSDRWIAEQIAFMADILPQNRPAAATVADVLRSYRSAPSPARAKVAHGEESPSPAPRADLPVNPATGEPSSGVLCECGHLSEMGARFCAKCGSPLMSRCIYCGHEAGAEDQFCGQCGHRI